MSEIESRSVSDTVLQWNTAFKYIDLSVDMTLLICSCATIVYITRLHYHSNG